MKTSNEIQENIKEVTLTGSLNTKENHTKTFVAEPVLARKVAMTNSLDHKQKLEMISATIIRLL